ncbi:WXG100 family type VII secretion target [Shouchella patagoniensis]|uniref:WXG100 family type VII secretion target n=1 Tax=Shouchella patagoniensis TaxID=228576 RepID=UPI000994EA30|nr:WXG100 family type VII secretion target [Shouchella patagoniensis]
MAGNIRVTPEELFTKAQEYTEASGRVQDLVSTLDGYRNQLEAMWDGQAREAFIAQYDELKPSFQRMGTLLEEVSQQIRSTGQTLQDTDQQIASNIRG